MRILLQNFLSYVSLYKWIYSQWYSICYWSGVPLSILWAVLWFSIQNILKERYILVASTTIYSFLKTSNPNPSFITPLTLLNPLFTNNKLQLPFSFLVCVSWFFLCILHNAKFLCFIRFFSFKLFFVAQLTMCSNFLLTSTTAIENFGTFSIARLCQMNSYQQIIHLCQNNKLFLYGCYIQATLVEYLTTWVPVEHKRDKPIIRMQIFYVLAKRTQVSLCYIFIEIFY